MATGLPKQRGMWLMHIVSKNLHTKYELNVTQNKGVIESLSWLPWQLDCHSKAVYGWCLLSQRTSMPYLKSVRLKTKELLRFHSGCHIMTISLVLNRNVVSAARDLVPTSKKTFTFHKLYRWNFGSYQRQVFLHTGQGYFCWCLKVRQWSCGWQVLVR